MVNVALLEKTIKDSGMTKLAVCKKAGISRQTLFNRYREPQLFTMQEVNALKDVLHLSEREYKRIFFAKNAE